MNLVFGTLRVLVVSRFEEVILANRAPIFVDRCNCNQDCNDPRVWC